MANGTPAVPDAMPLVTSWTASIPGATWIWESALVDNATVNEAFTFVKTFTVNNLTASTTLRINADNSYIVSVNGVQVVNDPNEVNFFASSTATFDITSLLHVGTNTFSATVTNFGVASATPQGNPGGLLYSITTNGSCGSSVPTLVITPASLPNGTTTIPYSQVLTATGTAIGPFAWTVVSGTLPTGLVLGTSTASTTSISGTPTATGTYPFVINVTNGSTTATQAYTITITAAPSGTCTLSPSDFEADLSNGQVVIGSIVPNVGSSTASFVLTNKTNCTAPISLSSYKMFVPPYSPGWLTTQQLLDVTSSLAVAPNATQTFTVKTASCMTQVDAWYGQAPTTLSDNGQYWYPTVPFSLIGAFTDPGNLCGGPSTSTLGIIVSGLQNGATSTVTVSDITVSTSTAISIGNGTSSVVLPLNDQYAVTATTTTPGYTVVIGALNANPSINVTCSGCTSNAGNPAGTYVYNGQYNGFNEYQSSGGWYLYNTDSPGGGWWFTDYPAGGGTYWYDDDGYVSLPPNGSVWNNNAGSSGTLTTSVSATSTTSTGCAGTFLAGTTCAVTFSLASSTPSADLSVTKIVDNASPRQGDTVHYTVTVSALGPATSTGVTATDTLPLGLSFVSATTSKGSYASSTGSWTMGT